MKKVNFLSNPKCKPFKRLDKRLLNKDILIFIKELKKDKNIPKYDMGNIASYFGVELRILKGYQDLGVFFWEERKIILRRKKQYLKYLSTFCHEIAHSFQERLGYKNIIKDLTISQFLRIEQQAEMFGYELSKIFFPGISIPKEEFSDYFDNSVIYTFYKENRKFHENDLIKLNKRGRKKKKR